MISLAQDMNLAQEIFLLFFAISHGIMIANLPKGSFPTDTAFSRREYKNGEWVDISYILIYTLSALA